MPRSLASELTWPEPPEFSEVHFCERAEKIDMLESEGKVKRKEVLVRIKESKTKSMRGKS